MTVQTRAQRIQGQHNKYFPILLESWIGRAHTPGAIREKGRKNVKIPVLKSSARIAARLNYLCPQFFPSPGVLGPQHLDDSTPDSTASSEVPKLCESISAENLLKFRLLPHKQLGLDRSCIPCVKAPSEIVDELLSEIPEIVDAAQQVSWFWKDPRESEEEPTAIPGCLENITREDTEIVLLGTGSSQPSKYRNVSSVYINLFSKGSLLLDCGEGTLGQLKRRYGVEGADNAVRGLKCIWISHIHADHHAGLVRILTWRRDLLKGASHEPLLVIGPRQLEGFLEAYERLEDLDMQFLDCSQTTHSLKADVNTDCSPVKKLKNVLLEAGLDDLISFRVVHCSNSFGVVLTAAERLNSVGKVIPGWKIVYSGDTRPCENTIEASHGATVVIHEATFEDGLLELAIEKRHSTTDEAIQVGESAGAYRIILTHFSQRYPKIPVFGESHMDKTCIAFDLMSVNLADLHVLPQVLPYIKLLFKNEMTVDESEDVIDEIEDV